MVAIKEHDRVVLTVDVPAQRLAAGDVGTVVHVYDDGKGFEVEFVSLDGARTLAVATLDRSEIRAVDGDEMTHARSVA